MALSLFDDKSKKQTTCEKDQQDVEEPWATLAPKIIWYVIKRIGLAMGIMAVSGGAAFYTLHWIYGTPIRNPRLPQFIIIGLVIQVSCAYVSYRSWLGKLVTLRNFIIYSMGLIFPFFVGVLLLRHFKFKITAIGPLDISILIVCGTLYYISYSFLKARNLLLPRFKGKLFEKNKTS